MKSSDCFAVTAWFNAYAVGTVPIRISMIRPMPFCPSFDPWAKLTPVQVRTSRARIQNGGGSVPSGASYNFLFFSKDLESSRSRRSHGEPDQRGKQQRLVRCCWLGPIHAAGAGLWREQLIGDAHSDDRTDQRVRTGRGQTEIPGAEVPDDRRYQKANTMANPRLDCRLAESVPPAAARRWRTRLHRSRSAHPESSRQPDHTTAM